MNSNTAAPTRQANFALIILLLAYILSFIDRNVMAVLIGPIREDLLISDFQYSLLHGFAFAMFYILLGLPIARLADRGNRKYIISIGVFFWSVMTCLCGAARSFSTLFMTRLGVGVGEAALSPAAYSMLSDLYPANKLARATSVYGLGITIGGGLAYIVGGAVYEYFSQFGAISLPLFGMTSAWQMTFIVVGLPGFIIVLLLALIKEPKRLSQAKLAEDHGSLAELRRQFNQHRRAYIGLIGSMSILATLGYGTMAWFPEFLIRTFDMSRSEAGSQFGMIFIAAGSLGAICGGWSVEPIARRGYQDAALRVILATAIIWLPIAALGPLAPTQEMAVLAAIPITFLLNAYNGVGSAALQLITPGHMRAQFTAIMLFFANLLGLALGPSSVAFMTDYVFGDDLALRYSLAILPIIVCPIAIVLLLQGLKPYRKAIQDSQSK